MPHLHPLSPNRWRKLQYNKVYKLDMNWVDVLLSHYFEVLLSLKHLKTATPRFPSQAQRKSTQVDSTSLLVRPRAYAGPGRPVVIHKERLKCQPSCKAIPHLSTFLFFFFFLLSSFLFLSFAAKNSKTHTWFKLPFLPVIRMNSYQQELIFFFRSNDTKAVQWADGWGVCARVSPAI